LRGAYHDDEGEEIYMNTGFESPFHRPLGIWQAQYRAFCVTQFGQKSQEMIDSINYGGKGKIFLYIYRICVPMSSVA
jgi:hypothetical protein